MGAGETRYHGNWMASIGTFVRAEDLATARPEDMYISTNAFCRDGRLICTENEPMRFVDFLEGLPLQAAPRNLREPGANPGPAAKAAPRPKYDAKKYPWAKHFTQPKAAPPPPPPPGDGAASSDEEDPEAEDEEDEDARVQRLFQISVEDLRDQQTPKRVGDAFFTVPRGVTSAQVAAGKVGEAVLHSARRLNDETFMFCIGHGLQQSFTVDIEGAGVTAATLLSLEWCARMNYFFRIHEAGKSLHDETVLAQAHEE